MKAIICDFKNTLYNAKKQQLFNGAKELLSSCRREYKQALVSSTFDAKSRMKLVRNLGVEKFFDRIEIKLKDKKLFLDICNSFKCKPEDAYVIGDNALHEIRIGRQLNMKTIWIARGKLSKIEEKVLKIHYWKKIFHFKELNKILIQ